MSPVSTDGSEWSGINQYSLPSPNSVRGFPTPPQSGAAHSSHNGPSDTTSVSSNSLTLPPSGRMSQKASPPSSVTSPSRVSDGTLSDQSNARRQRMEDMLSQHYIVLRRYLQGPSREESNIRSNRARDKLLRLSPVLFLELSTDVYDELLRRQAVVAASRPGPPRPEVPPHLLPRQEYHKKRNQARQKLSSLQDQRFKDLATDVFCELERRFPHFAGPEMNRRASPAPSMGGRFGGPRPDSNGQGYGYPGAPNGSRGPPPGPRGPGYHSGPGPGNRFPPRQGSLGAISATGLGINSEGMPDNAPYQKSFQNNTVVPNKSTMVEDDDADDDDDRRSDAFALDKEEQNVTRNLLTPRPQVSELQKKVEELELMHKEKEEEVNTLRKYKDRSSSWKAEKAEYEEKKRELEEQLSNTHNLNNAVLSQLEEARDRQKDAEMELEKLRQEQQSVDGTAGGSRSHDDGDDDWKSRFEDLDREHESLKAKLKQQQEVTEQVRQQASAFLQEMRALSDGHNSNWDREERLIRDVHRLEAEVKHWKNRYAKSKTQLRHLRSSSIGLPDNIQDSNIIAKDNTLTQPDGLVKDVHITKFQMAIDELLRIARSDEPSLVLGQMKGVVLAVRHITQDIDSAVNVNTATDDELTKIRARAKAQVSATANNLITASKNFGNSNGLSPVSLLDAAASHLTAAVVELVRKVKIRPTPEDELADEGEEDQLPPMQSPGYFSVAPSLTRFSGNESIYSAISSPPSLRSRTNSHSMSRNRLSGAKHGYPGLSPDKDLEELRLHLEDQTSSLVHSIQSLVASIRGEDSVSAIQLHINTIADAVEKVVTSTETTMAKPDANPALRDRAVPVIEILARHRDHLLDMGAEASNLTDGTEIRELNSKLPPIAFQITRETKELVQRIDQIEYASQNNEEDDFR
ncbi:cell polarity protein [Trichophyton tonsurans CBS 112818]|uniref:Cell polarity protein n=1 Tax=Trichophyton tonsurans (strain CBS 112818) TaxID=647933 RepID=F2S0T8_TRIT1|nr:cell polarity protein [Trichophyton tonsurans CBS 112818]